MTEKAKLLLVDSSVLPEYFLKVVQAKELLAKNVAKNSSHACEMVGISRSTFYRYKDCVEIFDDEQSKALTLYLSLNDKPGVLANVLDILRNAGTNVLTINQSMPISSVAPVCITLRSNCVSEEISLALDKIRSSDGVIDAKLVHF